MRYFTFIILITCSVPAFVSAQIDILKKINGVSPPTGFFFERSISSDTSKFLTIETVLPRTKMEGLQAAQKELVSIIEKEKLKFIKSIDPDPRMKQAASGNNFTCYPIELYKNDKIISFLFEISYSHTGAAHPMSQYYTFNYDIQKKTQLSFVDYFNLKNDQDKEALVQLINSSFEDGNIRVKKFYDFDFNIEEEAVIFNFDNYEIASYAYGLLRAKFNKNQIHRFINPTYLK